MKRLPKWGTACLCEELPKRNDETRALEDGGDGQNHVVPHRVLHRLGMSDLLHAFVKGQTSAHAEDQYRNNQAPEVQLFAMSEGMLGRGWPLAQLESHEQEDAVERVDSGVDAFGEHRRTARDAGDHKLGDCDRHVGRYRAVDRNFGVGHRDRISKSFRLILIMFASLRAASALGLRNLNSREPVNRLSHAKPERVLPQRTRRTFDAWTNDK